MRACYELIEDKLVADNTTNSGLIQMPSDRLDCPISFDSLVGMRSWPATRVAGLVRSAIKQGWLRHDSDGEYRLTQTGSRLALQAARNHRLWELYLIHFADVAPNRVDREADLIEHVLEPGLVQQLEELLKHDHSPKFPSSPHS